MILDHVDEVRSVAIVLSARDEAQRRELGLPQLLRLDETVLQKLVQHPIARFGGAFRTAIGGGIAIGGADDAGKKGSFADGDIANIFIEVGQRSFGKAMNGEAAAIPEVDLIGVEFENLLLGKTVLEFESHHGFRDLAAPGPLRGKEKAPRQLHGQGAGTLGDPLMAHIRPGRAKNANHVETGMLEETLVFGG